MDRKLDGLVSELGRSLELCNWRIATAESCTGGGIAEAMTAVPGSSSWFDRAYITYSNQAKGEMLGVSAQSLETEGSVSKAVVMEMVAGVFAASDVDIAIAVSGIAGPGGAVEGKPVGTVWIAWGHRGNAAEAVCFRFFGSRAQVRYQSICAAIRGAIKLCV